MGLGVLIYAGYAVAFSTSGAIGIYARGRRVVDGTVASLFALAGFGLIRSAFVRN